MKERFVTENYQMDKFMLGKFITYVSVFNL